MRKIDVDFCFYDDPDVCPDPDDIANSWDADRYSARLRQTHCDLWNAELPNGETLVMTVNARGWLDVTSPPSLRGLFLSSDTVAATHSNYKRKGMDAHWSAVSAADQLRYLRGFYKIGGFMVFPRHEQSINQVRGTLGSICDRFDLTLECIRRYYDGVTDAQSNPLGHVLRRDSAFFDAFGQGVQGFLSYIEFFYLQDLLGDGQVRLFDDLDGASWDFARQPLPRTATDYSKYLANVLQFVTDRNRRIDRAGIRTSWESTA